jgi:hypothetical protein
MEDWSSLLDEKIPSDVEFHWIFWGGSSLMTILSFFPLWFGILFWPWRAFSALHTTPTLLYNLLSGLATNGETAQKIATVFFTGRRPILRPKYKIFVWGGQWR